MLTIELRLLFFPSADWIIDMRPERGYKVGRVIFEGTPRTLQSAKRSLTSRYLGQ